jgi:hypothetical protein
MLENKYSRGLEANNQKELQILLAEKTKGKWENPRFQRKKRLKKEPQKRLKKKRKEDKPTTGRREKTKHKTSKKIALKL